MYLYVLLYYAYNIWKRNLSYIVLQKTVLKSYGNRFYCCRISIEFANRLFRKINIMNIIKKQFIN